MRIDIGAVPSDTVPEPGLVDLAIHARDLSLDEVLDRFAVALGREAGASEAEVTAAVDERDQCLVVVVDGLDEASDPLAIGRFLRRLGAADGPGRLRLLIGTRRGYLGLFGETPIMDLDDYDVESDIALFARRRLTAPAPDGALTPYADARAAEVVAGAVARRASPSFLVAQLTCAALRVRAAVDTASPGWDEQFPSTVDAAMDEYIARFNVNEDRARDLLRAAAFAAGDGIPRTDVWPLLARAISDRAYNREDVTWLLDRAGDLLVVSGTLNGEPTYRLFHSALVAHLRPRELENVLQRKIVNALETAHDTWSSADAYTQRFLLEHAMAVPDVDRFLLDPELVEVAPPAALRRAARIASTADGRLAANAIMRVLHHLSAEDRDSLSYLELAARQVRAPALVERIQALPNRRSWSTRWVHTAATTDEGIIGRVNATPTSIALIEHDRLELISTGFDGVIVRWDVEGSAPLDEPIQAHKNRAVLTAVSDGSSHRVVSAGSDGLVLARDIGSWEHETVLADDPARGVWSIAGGWLDDAAVVVDGGHGGRVRAIRVDDGVELWTTTVGAGNGAMGETIEALAVIDSTVIAVGRDLSEETIIRRLDLRTGRVRGSPHVIDGRVHDVKVVVDRGRRIAVLVGTRLWFLGGDDGTPRATADDHWARSVAVLDTDDESVPTLVLSNLYGELLLCEGPTSSVTHTVAAEEGHAEVMEATVHDGRRLVVTGGPDGVFRLWDVDGWAARHDQDGIEIGHDGAVWNIATYTAEGRLRVATVGRLGDVWAWDLQTGEPLQSWQTHSDAQVRRANAIQPADTPMLVTGTSLGELGLWDLRTGMRRGDLVATGSEIEAMCCSPFGRRPVLATADPHGSFALRVIPGFDDIAVVPPNDEEVRYATVGWIRERPIGVRAGRDGLLTVWDLQTGERLVGPFTVLGRNTPFALELAEVSGALLLITTFDGGPVVITTLTEPGGQRYIRYPSLARTVDVAIIHGRPSLLTAHDDGFVRIVDLATEQVRWTIDLDNLVGHVQHFAVPDGETLVVVTLRGVAALQLAPPAT